MKAMRTKSGRQSATAIKMTGPCLKSCALQKATASKTP